MCYSLREEQRIRVFKNEVHRKLFGAKEDEITVEWRKLHNSELHALYSSPNIIRNLKLDVVMQLGTNYHFHMSGFLLKV